MTGERHGMSAAWAWGAVTAAIVLLTAEPAPAQDAALVQRGAQLFTEQGCYGCHTVGKFGTEGIAPDLSHVGAKHDVAYLTKWLQDPASQKPTAHMPKIGVSADEARALAAYLGSLK
jgi:cytochrome c2